VKIAGISCFLTGIKFSAEAAHKTIIMKKTGFLLLAGATAILTWSCNDNNSSDTTSTDSVNNMNLPGDSMDTMTDTSNRNMPAGSTVPFVKADSMFVAEAAMGSLMEIEAGNMAQQMGSSQRVKDFGAMLVADHSKASNELKSLVNGRVMLMDSLPAATRKHLDAMKKMTGKAFDNHFLMMMSDDHKKDIAKFRKQSESGTDAQLKSWAGTTLPTLQKHMDTVQALRKGM